MKNTKKHFSDKPIGKITIIEDTFPKPNQLIKKNGKEKKILIALSDQATNIVQTHMADYGSIEAIIESALHMLNKNNQKKLNFNTDHKKIKPIPTEQRSPMTPADQHKEAL